MAHLKTKGLAVVFIVGSYPMERASVVSDEWGTDCEESIPYAGVGIPKFAKSEETEGYETYMEHTLASKYITEKSTVYNGKVTVAGIILACISESSHHTGASTSYNFDVI